MDSFLPLGSDPDDTDWLFFFSRSGVDICDITEPSIPHLFKETRLNIFKPIFVQSKGMSDSSTGLLCEGSNPCGLPCFTPLFYWLHTFRPVCTYWCLKRFEGNKKFVAFSCCCLLIIFGAIWRKKGKSKNQWFCALWWSVYVKLNKSAANWSAPLSHYWSSWDLIGSFKSPAALLNLPSVCNVHVFDCWLGQTPFSVHVGQICAKWAAAVDRREVIDGYSLVRWTQFVSQTQWEAIATFGLFFSKWSVT